MNRVLLFLVLSLAGNSALTSTVRAQVESASGTPGTSESGPAAGSATLDKVDVRPVAPDEDIAERLRRILEATGWFADVNVRVDEGVVFLHGSAKTTEVKTWAGNLARRTEGVVAVVNQMEVDKPPITDFSPAMEGLRELSRDTIGAIPFAVFGLVIFGLSFIAARLTLSARDRTSHTSPDAALAQGLRALGRLPRDDHRHLHRAQGVGPHATGAHRPRRHRDHRARDRYRVSRHHGKLSRQYFSQHAAAVSRGDLIEITGVVGYVQRLTVRTTVLMTLNGNQVAIPNATVYKSTIRNFSSNKNRREDFTVGIGYDDPIPHAQEVALKVLHEHPAVLKDPEPWALVDSLGSATVVLRVYFWLDGSEHSWLKVKSSIIRLDEASLSRRRHHACPTKPARSCFPTVFRCECFPHERKPTPTDCGRRTRRSRNQSRQQRKIFVEPVSTNAEGGLNSEAGEIKGQTKQFAADRRRRSARPCGRQR